MSVRPSADELRAQLDALEGEPLARHADMLESLHGQVVSELDRLVIPRAETRPGQ